MLAAPAAGAEGGGRGSTDAGGDWPAFAKRLRRIYADAIRLEQRDRGRRGSTPRLARLHGRLIDLALALGEPARPAWRSDCGKYGDELFTFVELAGVPSRTTTRSGRSARRC